LRCGELIVLGGVSVLRVIGLYFFKENKVATEDSESSCVVMQVFLGTNREEWGVC
jgi:hypothetical protein